MKSPLLVSLLALGVSAVALGTLLATPRTVAPRAADALPPAAAPDADLGARVEALAEENRALRDRLALLENASAAGQRAPATQDFALAGDLEALRDEVREALARRADLPAQPTVLKEQVAGTLAELRKEEAVERVREQHDRRLARLDDDVARIGTWLELTPLQSSRMRSALQTQYDREAEVRRLWEEGAADEVVGEHKRSAGEQFQADLAAFLGPDQLATFVSRVGAGKK